MMSKKGIILGILFILSLGVLKVNPAEAAKRLIFVTPAQEIATGVASNVMTLQVWDEDSQPYTLPGNITVQLAVTNASTGASLNTSSEFSLSQSSWNNISSKQITISSGSSSTSFYYKYTGTSLTTITITAAFSGYNSATQNHELENGIFVNRVYDRIDGVHYHYETYNISSSETWTTEGSPYIIERNVTVASGQTLQINPGVQVKFAQGHNISLTVSGKLTAVGTAATGITFTSNAGSKAAGDWRGIIFSGSGSSGSSLKYCTLAYGGSPSLTTTRGMIECNNTSDTAGPTISNCTIQHSQGYGLYTSGTSSPIITTNTFSNCAAAAICSEAGTTTTNSETITGNTITTVDGGWAIIKGGPAAGIGGYNISSNTISAPLGTDYGYRGIYIRQAKHAANTTFYPNVPYVFEDISVDTGRTLTIRAGTVLKGRQDTSSITIKGIVNAAGSNSNPIVFTSFNDDTYGGDTNDSTVTAAANDWKGVTFNSTATVTAFSNCIERYAAGIIIDGTNPTITNSTFENNVIGVHCKNSAAPTLTGCIIKNNTTGIYSELSSNPTVRNCYITSNDYGVKASSNSRADIQYSCIWDNDSYGVYSDNTSNSTTATNNWWGNNVGPNFPDWTNAAQPLYTSDTANINVNYSPALADVLTINNPPTADAGEYGFSYGGSSETIQADTGNRIILSGGGSHDPDWDYLAYVWSLVSAPSWSSFTINDLLPNTASQQVYFDAVSTGTYVFQLIVNDAGINNSPGYNSAPDILTILVEEGRKADEVPVYLADDSGNTFSTMTKAPGDTVTVRVYVGATGTIPGLGAGSGDKGLLGISGTINYTKPSIIEPTTVTVNYAFFDPDQSDVVKETNLDGANGEVEFGMSSSDSHAIAVNGYVLETIFTISAAAINGDTIYITIDDLAGNTTGGGTQLMYAYAASPQLEIGIDADPPAFVSAIADGGTSCDNILTGDTITIVFDERIDTPSAALTGSNINTILAPPSGKTWGNPTTITWNAADTQVEIVLTATTTLAIGDIITSDGTTLVDTPAGNPVTGTIRLTGNFGRDCSNPTITSATAYDGIGNNKAGIQAGDYVIIKFSESIDTSTSIALTASSGQIGGVNINTVLVPSRGTWKDGSGAFSTSSTWYRTTYDSDTLKIIFTTATSAPTITPGITITANGATLADDRGNTVYNSVTLGGSFGTDAYIWPGDADNDGDVDAADVLPIGIHWGRTGSARVGASTSWSSQSVYVWSPEAATYADGNGDGTVNASDVLVIGLNWGKTHNPNAAPSRSPQFNPAYYAEHLDAFRAMYKAIKNSPDTEGNLAIKNFLADIILQGVAAQIPDRSTLSQNYPNPFNPETWLPFALAAEGSVKINIYNLSGQLIRTMDMGKLSAGTYVSKDRAAYWDGRDESGQEVASGAYLYQLTTKDSVSTRKMIILK